MNKIKVVNNKIIPFDNNGVNTFDNNIIFLENGNYYIEYIDCDDIDINITVNDNICISLFELSSGNDIKTNIKYNINRNASLILSKFYNNINTEEKINIYLNKENADIRYSFSSISSGNEKYLFNIYHLDKKTNSNIFNKVIAKEGSLNNFDINSFVDNGVKDCYLKQETKIVTLGESQNKINPNMFIGENSTTAIHSSVIGSVDNDSLFYLMTRGIDYKTSINLIIKGMVLSNINPDMDTRKIILDLLEKLGG
ncbi:MAG: SufD family Fe-S cluster assembly protein [Bacilli bacterium]